MAQLELEDNLARFHDPRGRLIAKILMATGLRVGDACRLLLGCITRDEQGAPYLHYTNHKMRRDAFVPIGVDLAAAVGFQQQRVLADIPSGTCLLPRPTRNPDGHFGFSPAMFRGSTATTADPVRGPRGHRRLRKRTQPPTPATFGPGLPN
jgi:hypothetical protein